MIFVENVWNGIKVILYQQIILMSTEVPVLVVEATQIVPKNDENPQVQCESPKIQKQTLKTKPSSIQKTKTKRSEKSKSPVREDKKRAESPSKQDIEDEMEKYFEEYAVMETIPSSKRLQDEKTLKKEKRDNKNKRQESQGQQQEEEESNIDEEELYRYKQLENKLNFALNKIQLCKDSSKKSFKMTDQGADELYKRFEYYEKKKREELERKKQEREEDEVRMLQKKPSINASSSRLVGSMDPIYERYERVLNVKEKKLEQQRLKIKKQKEEEEELFFREFEERNKRPEKTRTTEEFYDGLVRWKELKTEKNSEKLQSNKKREMADATFHPSINERSKKLMAKKPPRQPIFEREPKPKVAVQQYSFKPKINKKVPTFN